MLLFLGFNTDLSMQPRKKATAKTYVGAEERMKKLQAVLQCCLLRRTKSTRIDGSDKPIITLPSRVIDHDQPEFTEMERELYDALEKRNLERFDKMMKTDRVEKHYRSILVMIMRSTSSLFRMPLFCCCVTSQI